MECDGRTSLSLDATCRVEPKRGRVRALQIRCGKTLPTERERSKNWLEIRMKFAPPIKFFQAGCVAAAIGFGMMRTEAQTTAFTFPPIGTYSNVLNYAAAHVNLITLTVWVWNTNNAAWKAYFVSAWYASATNYVTSKTQMDQQIIAAGITNVVSQVITNTNPTIDKSKGVLIYTTCGFQTNSATSYETLDAYEVISLPKNPDGSYGMPDLASFSTTLSDYISFYVPNLQWARLEIGDKGNTDPFEVDDELYNPGTDPIDSAGFLEINTDYITNSASVGGTYWIKITTFNGTFQIFNGDGNQIPETPMLLALNQHGTNATVTVNGGDSGLGFVLQSSAALTAWTNCGPVTFISPTNDLPGALPSQFVYPATSRSLFFRTATTNLPPM
jgi:hypothetical protein